MRSKQPAKGHPMAIEAMTQTTVRQAEVILESPFSFISPK
jgi:hypothetical protein